MAARASVGTYLPLSEAKVGSEHPTQSWKTRSGATDARLALGHKQKAPKAAAA